MRTMIVVAALAAAAGTAAAGTITNVGLVNGAGSERGVGEIYSALTGMSMSNSDVNSVGAGALRGIGGRVSDDADNVWRDGTVHVGFAALYWGNSDTPDGNARHNVSVSENNAATTQLFTAGPNSGTNRGEVFTSGVFPTTAELRFSAHNERSGRTANTDAANNNGRDRVITFDITGLDVLRVSELGLGGEDIDLTLLPPLAKGKGAYLMFFETGSDNDFQDFVMLAYNLQTVTAIPTPTAAAAGLLGLGGLAARRRR